MLSGSPTIAIFLFLTQQMALIQVTTAVKISNYSTLLPGFKHCYFEGYRYNIGETFHPKVEFNGETHEMLCTTCTCNPTTKVQCEKKTCPTLSCDNPVRLKGECCDRCPGENLSGIELQSLSSQPMDCTLEGVTYRHGSTFHPPSNMSSHTDHIYCTVYTCNNGTTSHTDVSSTCPPVMACDESKAFHVTGLCCKICPEVNLTRGECKDELGNPRKGHETWNYYSAVYLKRLTCLNCSCEGSSFTCKKNPCPPVPPCTDKDKEEALVICCPKCSRGTIIGTPPTPVENNNNTTPELYDCTDIYNYRIFLCNSTSMAIENVKNKTVVNYVWLANGIKQAFGYTSAVFKKLSCSHPDKYRGGTIERRVNGLQTRETKRMKILNCKKDCAEMVVNMLRPVPLNKQEC